MLHNSNSKWISNLLYLCDLFTCTILIWFSTIPIININALSSSSAIDSHIQLRVVQLFGRSLRNQESSFDDVWIRREIQFIVSYMIQK